jgi:hypothetical protein
MSSMMTVVAFRIPFDLNNDLETGLEKKNFIKRILGREPDEFFDNDDWHYESKKGTWVIHNPDNKWYLDYVVDIERDGSEIDTKVPLGRMNSLMTKGLVMLDNARDVGRVSEGFLHMLYFYNGGASGLSDIS